MIFLYSFAVSILLFSFFYYRLKQKEKKLEKTIEAFSEKKLEPVENFSEVKEVKEVKEEVKEEIDFQKIKNPDKDKPFARISSPSKIETKEYEEINEKALDITPKQRKKYVKKIK